MTAPSTGHDRYKVMPQSHYDRLVRDVTEFQDLANEFAPGLGKMLDKQLDLLQKELRHTQYDKKIRQSLKRIKLEDTIRRFIRRYKPQLINMATQHNPYMERGLLTQFINRKIFFKLLKEEKGIHFDFERALEKTNNRYKALAEKCTEYDILTPEKLILTVKSFYHRYQGMPTGGRRPKLLISVKNVFNLSLEENYYQYKGKPFAVVHLPEYKLFGVLDLTNATLHLHVSQKGYMSPKWETYIYPRNVALPIHEQPVRDALTRALRNNQETPMPIIPKEEAKEIPPKLPEDQRRTSAIDAIRKKLVPMVRRSYIDPLQNRIDVMVPVTKDGKYCDIASSHAVRLLMFKTDPVEPPQAEDVATEMFRRVLPFAIVVNPGEAVPLRDFVRFVPNGSVVSWMSRNLQPTKR